MWEQVLAEELLAIKQAAKAIYPAGTAPEVLVLVTQKRHSTRLFQIQSEKLKAAWDPRGHPLPGLIVDQGAVISRTVDQWYSVSHRCLQGTSRSAQHVRLWDEIKLSKDELEQLVHNLSFIYPRSVTSVSTLTPSKLAALLCERAKIWTSEYYFPSESDRASGRTWSLSTSTFLGQQSIHPNIRDTMYYI
jgi:eukaryotic translation initiation factor 2C